MCRLKTYAGLGIFLQCLTFLSVLVFASPIKRSRAFVCGVLAALCGTLGTYLVLGGAKESSPALGIDDAEDIFGVEDVPQIQCSILADD